MQEVQRPLRRSTVCYIDKDAKGGQGRDAIVECIEHASAKMQHKPSEGRCKPQEARRNKVMILSEGTGPTI